MPCALLPCRIRPSNPIQRETSQILNKVFATLRREGVGKADIARELDLYPEDLDALVFRLAILPVMGTGGTGKSSSYERRPSHPPLRLVTS
jgi:hypothetical protein